MNELLLPLLTVVSTGALSPGPNNLICLDTGKNKGFLACIPYIGGAIIGYSTLLIVVAFFSNILVETFPIVSKYLGYLGAGYLSYMGITLIINENKLSTTKTRPQRTDWKLFFFAMMFQFINPKAWLFSLSIVPSFGFHNSTEFTSWTSFVMILMSFMTFVGLCMWSYFGLLIHRYFKNHHRVISYTMSAFLFYSALALIKS